MIEFTIQATYVSKSFHLKLVFQVERAKCVMLFQIRA
jgi:hypothetical protein